MASKGWTWFWALGLVSNPERSGETPLPSPNSFVNGHGSHVRSDQLGLVSGGDRRSRYLVNRPCFASPVPAPVRMPPEWETLSCWNASPPASYPPLPTFPAIPYSLVSFLLLPSLDYLLFSFLRIVNCEGTKTEQRFPLQLLRLIVPMTTKAIQPLRFCPMYPSVSNAEAKKSQWVFSSHLLKFLLLSREKLCKKCVFEIILGMFHSTCLTGILCERENAGISWKKKSRKVEKERDFIYLHKHSHNDAKQALSKWLHCIVAKLKAGSWVFELGWESRRVMEMGKPTFCFSPVWHFTGENLLMWKTFFFKTGNTTFGDEQIYCYFFLFFFMFFVFFLLLLFLGEIHYRFWGEKWGYKWAELRPG